VTLPEELTRLETIFFDTAPIYYIEAHPRFGPLAKEVVQAFQAGRITAYSSVITLAEVLAKPAQLGKIALAKRFADFLLAPKLRSNRDGCAADTRLCELSIAFK
jgi:hypothetical protein